ncbi:MAG: hypothetical protein Q8N28_02955 [bacterium]|nr:hypothetical protein [bacterium]
MNKNLLENLKELRQIQPDSNYTTRSRFLILAEPTATENLPGFKITQIYKPAFAIGLISIFVLMALGGIYQIIKPGQNDLVVRANEINSSIQVKLDEIKYLIENNNHLNAENILNIQALLEKTTNELKEASILSQENKDLGKSLEKIKSAQEILLQIDAMLQ